MTRYVPYTIAVDFKSGNAIAFTVPDSEAATTAVAQISIGMGLPRSTYAYVSSTTDKTGVIHLAEVELVSVHPALDQKELAKRTNEVLDGHRRGRA